MKNLNYTALAIKKYVPRILWTKLFSPIGRLIFAPYQFFWATGWLRSMFRGTACNAKGEHMPWLSMPAVEYLESIQMTGKRVLELGGGSSTLYFARRGATVYCLEQNANWLAWLRCGLARITNPNIYLFSSLETLAEAVKGQRFDYALLDDNPHDKIMDVLFQDSFAIFKVLIIDNTEVPWQERGKDYITKYLTGKSWRIDFTGFALGNCIQQTTSMYIGGTCNIPDCQSTQPKVYLTNQKFKHEI